MSGGNIYAFARRGDLRSLRQNVEEFAGDVNEPDVHKMAPLHYGARRGHLAVVQYLLQRRADPELRNGTGQTPLLAAAQNGQADVVDCLIAGRADPNAEADHGVRALHRAAAAGYEDIVRMLLKGRADPLAIDGFLMEGAVHHAAREGHPDVVRTLMGSVTRPQRPPEGAADDDMNDAMLALREAALLNQTGPSGLSGVLGLKAQSIDEGNSRGQSRDAGCFILPGACTRQLALTAPPFQVRPPCTWPRRMAR
jgi:ankyrin repeat protein